MRRLFSKPKTNFFGLVCLPALLSACNDSEKPNFGFDSQSNESGSHTSGEPDDTNSASSSNDDTAGESGQNGSSASPSKDSNEAPSEDGQNDDDSDTEEDGPAGSDVEDPRFDVEAPDSMEMEEEPDKVISYIWIANSGQSTVSKIDTREVIEEGRYLTRADSNGNPSRTSVNLSGDAAVANRNGGIMKIYADPRDCEDKNGDGRIRTARDKNFLDWEDEECVAWYADNFESLESQRALAWTQGVYDPEKEEYRDQKLWVSGWEEDTNRAHIALLNGDTGRIERQIDFTPEDQVKDMKAHYGFRNYTAYGGAVDPEGNFWFTNLGEGLLGRVNFSDMSLTTWDKTTNSYGMTVDHKGRAWTCALNLVRFDPVTESWAVSEHRLDPDGDKGVFAIRETGCMLDGEGNIWTNGRVGTKDALIGIDLETMLYTKHVVIPSKTKGVSVDIDGFIWGVRVGNQAFRGDPETQEIKTFDDLTSAYTYSDMTGFALLNTTKPPTE